MKTWLIALLASALGFAIGTGITVAEFSSARDTFVMTPDVAAPSPRLADGSNGMPQAVIKGEKVHNFGVMERDVKGEHTFTIINQGTGPLTVKVGHTTCKCTIAKLKNEELAPGESTEIKMEWEAKSYVEAFHQSAEIETNDPASRIIRLEIVGNVIQSVRPIPEELTLSGLSANEESTAVVMVYGFSDQPLEIREATLVNPEYADKFALEVTAAQSSELAEVENAKSGQRVTLRVAPGLPVGPLSQTIRLETNIPTAEVIEVPVHLTVASDISIISATPRAEFISEQNVLRLGKMKSSQGATAQMYVLVKGPHRHETQLSVASVEPAPTLQATLGEATPLRDGAVLRYPLKLSIPPGQPAINRFGGEQGELGKIILHTTHPVAKEVRLFVQFAIE